ncbi:hypothetical protein SAMN04490248_12720 [Salinihabitans flavidus]|uniref:DUF2059 domain-containing protein n=1 Tax=Salinihabitans flavidus TaxID=569882 RepID=A0A1H8VBB0_9RHOB|nr:hypothetical protein [Salinihabitans flavidus]SEP12601.1 hypothetical protein SAMN04490248_12720 [Salinihabitans flavidus]
MIRLRGPVCVLLALLCLPVAAARAEPGRGIDAVMTALDIPGFVAVMRVELLAQADEIAGDLLGGNTDGWTSDVGRILNEDRMTDSVREGIVARLAPVHVPAVLKFFESDLGQQIIAYEIEARWEILNPALEKSAMAAPDLLSPDDPRLALVQKLGRVNDLIDLNVEGALNSRYSFFRGLSVGGGSEMTEEDILSTVWRQEPELRAQTEEWLDGYGLLAYEALSDAELQRYIAFSITPAGQALNHALFDGFDRMYSQINYALGLAMAHAIEGERL